MRILLTGGTGLIGRALCQRWHSVGHELIVWSRRPQDVPTLCHGARGIASLDELPPALALDAVINLAGAPILDRPWTRAYRTILWQSRIDLTRKLVEWLAQREQRPAVLISGSATGWYGDHGEEPITEDSQPAQTDFGSRLCQAWEREAQQAADLGIRVALIRTAPVLAPAGGLLQRLRLIYSLGLGGRLGNGRQWMPWVHLDDEVGLIDHLMMHDDCAGPYNACAPQAVRNLDFTRSLAAVMQRPACLPVPAWLLRLLLGEASILLLGGQNLSPRRSLQAGYVYRYPQLEPALRDVLGKPAADSSRAG